MGKKAMILRIERTSISDGDGMRTVLFFKGCPLRCAWCSTPESHLSHREVYYKKERCVGCGACLAACPHGALKVDRKTGRIVRDRSLCKNCFLCVETCMHHAMMVYGREMTVSEVMREIEKDEVFYFHSGGGVTLSGGDVLLWTDFAEELLRECEASAIDASAELDLYGDRENALRLVPYFSNFYVDLKHMDPEKHRQYTGVDNSTILENLRAADGVCAPGAIRVRVPLISGINDDAENIRKTAEFCASLQNVSVLEFLPYHRLGIHAYDQLGEPYALRSLPRMTTEEAAGRVDFLRDMGLPFIVQVDGSVI